MSNQKKKKKDASMFIVVAILLLIPLAVDEAFVRLKVFLRSSNPSVQPGQTTQETKGINPSPKLDCIGHSCHSKPNYGHGTAQGLQGGGSGYATSENPGRYSGGAGLSGLEALAQLERQQLDAFNQLVRSRYGRKSGEVWTPIEPMPSNPSRFFPELPKPRLSSGIALTTSPDDPRPSETIRENNWGIGAPVKEERRENNWGKGSPVAEVKRENNWGKGSPVKEERKENNWGQGTAPQAPPVVAKQQRPIYTPTPPIEQEAPRIVFQSPPKARPTEQARTEKLIEVCGRKVPMSQAATVSLECSPQPAPEPTRKPASETLSEGGDQKIFMH